MQLQTFSHVVSVSSDKTYSYLEGSIGAYDAINKTLNLLVRSRDSTLNVDRALQQVVMSFSMIRHMALKGLSPDIPLDVFQKVQSFLRYGTMFHIASIITN